VGRRLISGPRAPAWWSPHALPPALAAALAALALTIAGRPWGPWWTALLAAGLLWGCLTRVAPRRGAAVATLALTPVPATAYEGLRTYDPVMWCALVVVVAATYGLVGGAAAHLAARAWPSAPLPARGIPWLLAWAWLDLLVTHGPSAARVLPVTPGYALIGGPFVALAALAGPMGLGIAWGVIGCAASGAVRAAAGSALPGDRWWLTAAAALVALSAALHVWAIAAPLDDARTVAITQRPAPESDTPRWREARDGTPLDAATATDAATLLAAWTALAATAGAADLHVWPEAALGSTLAADPAPLRAHAATLDAAVLAGAYRRGLDGSWRNAVVLADESAARFVLDKHRLVPRYEAWLAPGVGELWPVLAAGWRLGVLVCWESLDIPTLLARAGGGVDVLVVVVNDAWAADTVTPWWHARAGRLAAWASGRPVIVASYDGPSMVWTHDGQLAGIAPRGVAVLRTDLAAPRRGRTPYAAMGGLGLALLLALATASAHVGYARSGRAMDRGTLPP
jgi:apolipoprotein N-acyltransferase